MICNSFGIDDIHAFGVIEMLDGGKLLTSFAQYDIIYAKFYIKITVEEIFYAQDETIKSYAWILHIVFIVCDYVYIYFLCFSTRPQQFQNKV